MQKLICTICKGSVRVPEGSELSSLDSSGHFDTLKHLSDGFYSAATAKAVNIVEILHDHWNTVWFSLKKKVCTTLREKQKIRCCCSNCFAAFILLFGVLSSFFKMNFRNTAILLVPNSECYHRNHCLINYAMNSYILAVKNITLLQYWKLIAACWYKSSDIFTHSINR